MVVVVVVVTESDDRVDGGGDQRARGGLVPHEIGVGVGGGYRVVRGGLLGGG